MKVELRHNPKDNYLGVTNTSSLNKIMDEGKYPELIMLSEAHCDKRIVGAAFMIKKLHKRLVLIAGPSSSGKTTFAKKLCIQLKVEGIDPLYLSTDDYFLERENTPLDENGEPNFEDLDALDLDLFNRNLSDLLAGKEVDLPTFNFLTGKKEFGKRITSIDKNQPIVIEGIHALNDSLTPEFKRIHKFKIYICPITAMKKDDNFGITVEDHRLLRRISRDYLTRNHSAEETILSWGKVRQGEEKNIIPYSKNVEMFFNSSHIYEIPILKGRVYSLLKEIPQDSLAFPKAQQLIGFLQPFKELDGDEELVPNDSILREFIGGSIYRE